MRNIPHSPTAQQFRSWYSLGSEETQLMCEPKSPQLELGCGSVVGHLLCTGIESMELGFVK